MMNALKLFGWRVFAAVCLVVMTPLAVLMGDWQDWKKVWSSALELEKR